MNPQIAWLQHVFGQLFGGQPAKPAPRPSAPVKTASPQAPVRQTTPAPRLDYRPPAPVGLGSKGADQYYHIGRPMGGDPHMPMMSNVDGWPDYTVVNPNQVFPWKVDSPKPNIGNNFAYPKKLIPTEVPTRVLPRVRT
jgi:hypothetical protein